jgi:Holliday junction resolvase RusA-like endonuclease
MARRSATGIQPVGTGLGVVLAEGERFTQASISAGAITETRALIQGMMLPLPPTTNSYWNTRIVFNKGQQRHMGIPYTTHEAKEYAADIEERIMDKQCRYFSKQPLEMTMIICPRDARRQDISNRLKTFEDALKNAGVFEDDCQMVGIHLLKGPTIKQGRVVLFLSEVRIDVDMILSRAMSMKYIAPGYQEPVIRLDEAPQQSGDMFPVDEVRDEARVRHPSRRQLASARASRTGGDK